MRDHVAEGQPMATLPSIFTTMLQPKLQPAPARWHVPGVGLGLVANRLQCLPQRADTRARPPQALGNVHAMSSAVYCDDMDSLSQAIAATKEAGSCVLDCEGYELGDKKGQLTIIQMIPTKPQSVSYIVDVMALQPLPGALQPLKQLLSDASVTKILFDCRNDSGALWHEQQCKLQGVMDLQLLDLLVWESTANQQQRLRRLKGFMRANTEAWPALYRGVYQMSGLRGALLSNKVHLPTEVQAHLSVKKNLPPGWSTAWLQRPLDPQLLEHAVYDVQSILALYQHFKDGGWVDRFKKEVRAGSKAYADLYVDVPYEGSNPYFNHPLLPLGIVKRLTPGGAGQAGQLKECSGCRRQLSEQCFTGKGKGKKFCRVCACIKRRINRGLT